jgi:hypothetical protein
MKDRVFIDPPEPKKLRIRDFYHLKWILISIGIVSVSTILQYIQDPLTLTTIGFFDTTLIENVSPVISVTSSIIAAIIISPIVEFEWMLIKEILKRVR